MGTTNHAPRATRSPRGGRCPSSHRLAARFSLPLALVGGVWLVWLLGHSVSVATMIGFIALAAYALLQRRRLRRRAAAT